MTNSLEDLLTKLLHLPLISCPVLEMQEFCTHQFEILTLPLDKLAFFMSFVTKVHWLILLSKQDNGDATAVFRVKFFCWCGWFARCWLARPLHLFSIVSLSLYGAIS